MHCIYLNPKYHNAEFAKTFLPHYINVCAQNSVKKNPTKYKAISDYLEQNYKLTLSQAIRMCCKNFEYVLIGPQQAEFRQNQNRRYKIWTIKSLYNLIDDGNLELKGTNIFNNLLKKINSNLQGYYRTFLLYNTYGKGTKWQ